MDKEEIIAKVFSYIDAIAEKLGVASELILQVYVKQKVMSGIAYTLTNLLVIALTACAFYAVARYARNNWDKIEKNDDEEGWTVALWIVGIISAAIIFILVADTPSQIMKIINPEYYAFKDILNLITGK